jgi:predicted ferric reductase
MYTDKGENIENATPVVGSSILALGGLSILAGVALATYILPAWLPGLTTSMTGEAPKVFWYLSRGSAMVAFVLLWASMALGLIITNKLARVWPGGPTAFDLHQYVSLLGLGFALFHATILIGDEYIQLNILRVLLPFASQNYEPFWVGLGQVALYIWALLIGSFYVRKQIGAKAWRWIHFSSFLTFALILAHGAVSGTDSQTLWGQAMYWFAGGTLLFLLYYRILVTVGFSRGAAARQTHARQAAVRPTAALAKEVPVERGGD